MNGCVCDGNNANLDIFNPPGRTSFILHSCELLVDLLDGVDLGTGAILPTRILKKIENFKIDVSSPSTYIIQYVYLVHNNNVLYYW